MMARDRIDAFRVYDIHLFLGQHGELRVQGPADVVRAARPALRLHKAEILRCLSAPDHQEPLDV